jgi:hypothetical protein
MKKTTLFELVLIFLMAATAYGYFSPKTDPNINSRLSMVKAVVDKNQFEIDKYSSRVLRTKDKAFFNGHYYSDKAIGSALLGIEFYYPASRIYYRLLGYPMDINIFKELITFLAIGLITAFLAPLLYSFVKQVSGRAGFSLLITTTICLGTPFFIYSTLYYGHSLAGLFLFVVFFLWFNARNEEKISPIKTLISAIFLGYACITEYPTTLIAFLLGLYILYVMWEKGQLFNPKLYLLLILGAAIPIGVLMLYNYAIFQNPFTTGYAYEARGNYLKAHQQGLMGIGLPDLRVLFYMTFHTTMGIFWQSPALLLAFAGWIALWKNTCYHAEAILSFGAVLTYFIIVSGYYMWWGGEAFTPRDLIPVLPFFAIPLAFLPRKTDKILAILAFISVVQIFIVAAAANTGLIPMTSNISTNSFYRTFQNSTMYSVYIPNFLAQMLVNNRGQEFFHLTGFASLIPLFIIEAVILALFIKNTTSFKQNNK